MARTSQKQAEAAFHRLRETLGKRDAEAIGFHDPAREGAWLFDYAPQYGGASIRAITADSPPRPGEDRPQAYAAETIVTERLPLGEFVNAVSFARRVMA